LNFLVLLQLQQRFFPLAEEKCGSQHHVGQHQDKKYVALRAQGAEESRDIARRLRPYLACEHLVIPGLQGISDRHFASPFYPPAG
jgi:hypothetical protein